MTRIIRSTKFWVAGAIATVALAGTAYAAIPGGDGTVHGCYAKSGGSLRVIDAPSTPASPARPRSTGISRASLARRAPPAPRATLDPLGPRARRASPDCPAFPATSRSP